jgi:hypothetical protein
MSQQPLLTDVSKWFRTGHGLTLQFYATDEEIQSWLVEALPVEHKPYKIVWIEPARDKRSGVVRAIQCDVESFLDCLNMSDRSFICWIWSQALSPNLPVSITLPVPMGKRLSALYSINGLVLMQHRRLFRPRVPPNPDIERYYDSSMIGVVQCDYLQPHGG